ncbi:hypothetical protein GDO86_003589 [Hymenochirus boettgeri]|uniref:Zinc finger protein 706 n=1 Tax=Hymenochirus boettgeri TaxID=247094 RepID=A0A8T2KA93_9PIPI|nr:hypothetical protein GDO86_003589 [Hymenochirus boettgeri]
MARGQQDTIPTENAKKQAKRKKHGSDQKAAAKAALYSPAQYADTDANTQTFKQHFESKHPKSPMPPELVDVQA